MKVSTSSLETHKLVLVTMVISMISVYGRSVVVCRCESKARYVQSLEVKHNDGSSIASGFTHI